MISEITKLSAAPNPASPPVSGWIQPIVMLPALAALALLLLVLVELELLPWMLELQASSSPPPPTTAAPALAARSRVRRLMLPGSASPGGRPPGTPREGVLSV